LTHSQSSAFTIRSSFALTIFLSAFLLFLVQPLISKIILPWFGGSTGVWATCMVFFQVMLCVGYAYAHFLQRLPPTTQRWCHWILLAVAVFCLPVMPGESWKPADGNFPTLRILTLLFLKTGLPYLALSTTGPLLQSWHARLFPSSQTYRLYALSNVASLVSLLLFPLWFERTFTSPTLSFIWSSMFVLFVLGCGFVAYCASRTGVANESIGNEMGQAAVTLESPSNQETLTPDPSPLRMGEGRRFAEACLANPPSFFHYLLWLSLPAFASLLLVAGTSHLCQDIASTPFLWILPLCLYLLSFILCFDAPRWYVRRVYVVMGLIGLYGVIAMRELDDSELVKDGFLSYGSLPILAPLWDALNWYTPDDTATSRVEWFRNQVKPAQFDVDLLGQIAMHCVALFSVFMICHGELTKRKPPPKHLTGFYLTISIGSAIGSSFVSFAAPLLFPSNWEWWFGLTICVVMLCAFLFQWRRDRDNGQAFQWRYVFFVIPSLIILATVLFQKSSIPLRIADSIDGTLAAAENAQGDFGELRAEFGDSESHERIPNTVAYVCLGLLAVVSTIGLAAYLMKSKRGSWYRWLVVNSVAFGIAFFYIRDTLVFSVPKIFEKPSPGTELTDIDSTVWRGRNFYGSLIIEEKEKIRKLQHGRILHGSQYMDGLHQSRPSTYYALESGVALAMDHVSQRSQVHLGAIGLGTGTLASFMAPNWTRDSDALIEPRQGVDYQYTVYEINPLVVSLSEGEKPWFSYLADARERGAVVNIELGDARLMMERQKSQAFDVLAVDAFSGDSIPVHLLTDEAMQVYRKHLRDDGILAIHISNRYLDLEPVCKGLALKYGYDARVVEGEGEDGYDSTWVLLTHDRSLTSFLDDTSHDSRLLSEKAAVLWTDSYSSLIEVLSDSKYGKAVDKLIYKTWYMQKKRTVPTLEVQAVRRWWDDGWFYCRTRDGLNHAKEVHDIRANEDLVERFDGAKWINLD
jgi:hypothetical protein